MGEPIHVSIPPEAGGPYPCPKEDGGELVIIKATADRLPGAWCPVCHAVFREVGEVSLADLDGAAASGGGEGEG